MFIFLFIVIIIIIVGIKNAEVSNQHKNYTNTNINDIYSNTLKNNKQQAYNNLNAAHKNHKVDNYNDENSQNTKKIGYKKCPSCGNTVSVNSNECFMCEHVFKEEVKNNK